MEAKLTAKLSDIPMNTPRTVEECWNAIAKYLSVNAPHLAKTLGPGLTNMQIAELEEALRRQLPDDFKELLYAGSVRGPVGIIPDPKRLGRGYNHAFNLLPPFEIIDQWRTLTQLFDSGEFDDRHAGVTCGDGVVQLWWSPGWLPFAGNGGGDYYCVDLIPTHPGQRGQVVFFCHEDSHRPLIALSTAGFMTGLVSAMRLGQYSLSPRGTTGLVRNIDDAFPDARDE